MYGLRTFAASFCFSVSIKELVTDRYVNLHSEEANYNSLVCSANTKDETKIILREKRIHVIKCKKKEITLSSFLPVGWATKYLVNFKNASKTGVLM